MGRTTPRYRALVKAGAFVALFGAGNDTDEPATETDRREE